MADRAKQLAAMYVILMLEGALPVSSQLVEVTEAGKWIQPPAYIPQPPQVSPHWTDRMQRHARFLKCSI